MTVPSVPHVFDFDIVWLWLCQSQGGLFRWDWEHGSTSMCSWRRLRGPFASPRGSKPRLTWISNWIFTWLLAMKKKESDHQHCSKLPEGLVSEYECESSESHPAGMHNSHCPESRFWRCSLPSLQPDAMFSQWHTHKPTNLNSYSNWCRRAAWTDLIHCFPKDLQSVT